MTATSSIRDSSGRATADNATPKPHRVGCSALFALVRGSGTLMPVAVRVDNQGVGMGGWKVAQECLWPTGVI